VNLMVFAGGVSIWGTWAQFSFFDGLLCCAFAAYLRFSPLGPRSVNGGQQAFDEPEVDT
jgi:hypothetical protein